MFQFVVITLISIFAIERLVKLPIYPAYKLLGVLALIAVGIDAILIHKAIVTGTDGWGFLACMITLFTVFGLGGLVAYVGSRERWW